MKDYLNLIQTLYAVNHNSGISITESRPLQNVARENANKLEKRKKACVTSHRPVNPTVNHVIPRVCNHVIPRVFPSIVSCSDNRNVALFIEDEQT